MASGLSIPDCGVFQETAPNDEKAELNESFVVLWGRVRFGRLNGGASLNSCRVITVYQS